MSQESTKKELHKFLKLVDGNIAAHEHILAGYKKLEQWSQPDPTIAANMEILQQHHETMQELRDVFRQPDDEKQSSLFPLLIRLGTEQISTHMGETLSLLDTLTERLHEISRKPSSIDDDDLKEVLSSFRSSRVKLEKLFSSQHGKPRHH